MKKNDLSLLVCPKQKTKLTLKSKNIDMEEISGTLVNDMGEEYPIVNGIPSLLLLDDREKNSYALDLFQNRAKIYDKYQHLSFETFFQNEDDVRNNMIGRLGLAAGQQILELNAGTGRDSVLIMKAMKPDSLLHVQDISMDMLKGLAIKFEKSAPICITQSNACVLPYPDNFFDCVYSFGGVGMNTYVDTRIMFRELVRVSKVGAKIVIGGLSLAPWLYRTDFGRILINHNSHYENKLTLENFPIEARDFHLSWILNGAGFLIEFTVGEGEPAANFDFEIPGERGGTLRTRYYGKLEGVTPEAVDLAKKARAKTGKSMHEWLDDVIKKAALKDIEG